MPKILLRVIVLAHVALSASGCCAVLEGVCDCVSCLTNGPRLPFLAAPPTAPTPTAPPVTLPTAPVRAHMAY
ncbi:MAG: hypothetical protein IT383_05310 [Deltaproteobacteria bacterium]|nr:hypothetical protein [Deltaproteobacteria bacterium]